jgi:hypothetical protein
MEEGKRKIKYLTAKSAKEMSLRGAKRRGNPWHIKVKRGHKARVYIELF